MDSFSSSIIAVICFVGAAVVFAAPYLWRRGVATRLPASITRSWPQTRAASIIIGVGMLMEGVTCLYLLFFLSRPDLSDLLLMLPGAILMFAGRVVEGALA